MNWISPLIDGVIISVRIVPRASKNELVGLMGNALKLRVCAPPVDGKANEAVVEFLSELLSVPRSRIGIRTGAKGRQKHVQVVGVTMEEVKKRLGL